jgi:hypothetical protein
MFLKNKPLSRRTLLKGAGFSLTLPMLDAMIPTVTAAPIADPKLAFIYFPHGAVMKYWTPQQTGKDFEFSPILKPLEPLRD